MHVFLGVLLVAQAVYHIDAASVSVSSNHMDLNGKAKIRFYESEEHVWAGLSNAHRFPYIKSGDRIALKLDYTSGSLKNYWMGCTTSYCFPSTCPGDVVMKKNKWSACRKYTFFIRAIGKHDGDAINSGDRVTLSSGYYSRNYRLRCSASTSYRCNIGSAHSDSGYIGNNWFPRGYTIFEMFSRNSVDGTPVQYGDTVAFRYSYWYGHTWLYYAGGRWYARSCSYNNKFSCARQNHPTGLQIFKKL